MELVLIAKKISNNFLDCPCDIMIAFQKSRIALAGEALRTLGTSDVTRWISRLDPEAYSELDDQSTDRNSRNI